MDVPQYKPSQSASFASGPKAIHVITIKTPISAVCNQPKPIYKDLKNRKFNRDMEFLVFINT